MLTAAVERRIGGAAARLWRTIFLLAFAAYYGAILAGGFLYHGVVAEQVPATRAA